MSAATFDLEQHRTEKRRRLEREVEHLRRHRDQLERLLALCLQTATAKTTVTPLALLSVLEELDTRANESQSERVLRETA